MTLIDADPDSYLKTVGIIKKYYSPGSMIVKEKEIFDVVRMSRGLSEQSAREVLKEVKKYVVGLDTKKIEIKKSNLIKEIHYAFGKDFFDVHRIPEYRLFASIQMLIEQYKKSSGTITESLQKLQLEESMIKYMTSKDQTKKAQTGEKVDTLVATLAMKKFEERYSGVMNEGQKKVLRMFMNYSMTGNKEQFGREMQKDKENVSKRLSEARTSRHFVEDKIMTQKLEEATKVLSSLEDMTSDSSVQEMLLFHKLLGEIDSNE